MKRVKPIEDNKKSRIKMNFHIGYKRDKRQREKEKKTKQLAGIEFGSAKQDETN